MIPFVSVVVPTYNRYDLLRRCLESISKLDYPADKFEVIVVDDGSEDKTKELTAENKFFGLAFVCVHQDSNQGAAAARNAGLKGAQGDFLAFLDDDCVVEPDWLKMIVDTFVRLPQVSAVGGSVVNAIDSPVAWAEYILDFSMWLPVGRMRPIRDIPACNIAYRRADIEGMVFPTFRCDAVYEDSLFNRELRLKGKTIIFHPGIKVYHCLTAPRLQEEGFFKSQRRYGLGFIQGGYAVHGLWGKLLFHMPFLNIACPRLIFVLFRCLRSQVFLRKFFSCFMLLVAGEWERNRIMFNRKKYLLRVH